MQRFHGGLVFKAHGLCVSLNSRLESNKEEEKVWEGRTWIVVFPLEIPDLGLRVDGSGLRVEG